MSPQPVPLPAVRSRTTGSTEPLSRLVTASPQVVPTAVVVPLQPAAAPAQRRATFAQARAALARLGREDG